MRIILIATRSVRIEKKVNNELYSAQLFNDHFQNYKSYGIPKAQLIIADIPYNISKKPTLLDLNGFTIETLIMGVVN